MASYKKIQLFDTSFLKGTATSAELTAHINERVVYLQGECGGSDRCEISSVNITFVDKSNPFSQGFVIPTAGPDEPPVIITDEINAYLDSMTHWLMLVDFNKTVDV